MKKGPAILLLGLLLCAAAAGGIYYFATAPCRAMMRQAQPELAWLRQEFHLTDAEFARITKLHKAYLPKCRERCRRIEEQNAKLERLLSGSPNISPEIQAVLGQRASLRAECEAEMLEHFLEVSRTMPPEQGRRYLAWVQQQSSLTGAGMEQQHHTGDGVDGPLHGGHSR